MAHLLKTGKGKVARRRRKSKYFSPPCLSRVSLCKDQAHANFILRKIFWGRRRRLFSPRTRPGQAGSGLAL